jgi:putative phosphoesterase
MTVKVSFSIPSVVEIASTRLRVGLISDTHGLLRPEAKDYLRGCDFIVHGGDIGDPKILNELSVIAPVTAVRGNNDKGQWAENLNEDAVLKVGEIFVYVIHDLVALQMDPQAAGIHVVVSGHSHIPLIKEHEGVLYVNPGSSGPRRFKLPIAIGELIVTGKSVSASTVELDVAGAT